MCKYCLIIPIIFLLSSCGEEMRLPQPKGEIQVHQIYSDHVQDNYNLYIHLPPNYDKVEKNYRVMYVLDGEDLTAPILAAVEELKQNNQIREDYILVGIDTGTDLGRFRDLTPGVDKSFDEPTGGADKFYAFLTQELIPLIAGTYRVEPRKNIIYGHSLGGLFVLYSFFHDNPEAPHFSGYIAQSPSIWYNDGVLYDYERKFFADNKGKPIPARLYMMAGGLESIQSTGHLKAMLEKLEARKYPSLQIKAAIKPATTHTFSKNDKYYDLESILWTLD